jgi:hypothetical protein
MSQARARGASGKNSRNFHTLGYEMGNLQKLVFLHTQKVLFHTLKNNFILYNFFSYLQSLFHTLKTFFIPLYINFMPLKFVSYLENFFHTFYATISYLVKFFCYIVCFHFIPSTSISYPEHGISYQVSFSTLLIARLIVCIHSFTTERTSHVCGCFL